MSSWFRVCFHRYINELIMMLSGREVAFIFQKIEVSRKIPIQYYPEKGVVN